MKPRAAPFIEAGRWAPLPGSMSLAEADAILADVAAGLPALDFALRHGMGGPALVAFVARNVPEAARAFDPEAA